jgi:ligand-binding sensor domain-containing protein/serine phosphatase RsbU (regulator of sigma subunit)
MHKKIKLKHCAGAFLFLLFTFTLTNAQTYNFKNWGQESRLPDTYIYYIIQDNQGFLWISTGTGLVKFDGFDFNEVVFPDSVNGRYVSAAYKDTNGRIWLGCNDGSLFYTLDGNLVKLNEQGIQGINEIINGEEGFIYVIPQDKVILKININRPGEIKRYLIRRNLIMASAAYAGEDYMLLGTQENLLYCRLGNDSVIVEDIISGIEYTKVQAIEPAGNNGIFLIGTEGSGLFRLNISDRQRVLTRFSKYPELEALDIKAITRDSGNNFWLSTYGSGLLQTTVTGEGESISIEAVYNTSNGLQGDNVRAVFRDMEDNLWVGLYGEGLSQMDSFAYTYYAPFETPDLNNIIYISEEGDYYFLGYPKGYYLFNPRTGKTEQQVDLSRYFLGSEITTFQRQGSLLWIGTKGGGVYLKNQSAAPVLIYRSGNTAEDYIRNITVEENRLWLSTLNGVVVIDKRNGNFLKRFKIEDRLPHNSINQIYINSKGKALVATECDRLYSIDFDSGVIVGKQLMTGITKNKILSFAEDKNGVIYAATSGNGFFIVKNDSIKNLTTADGLFSNYCYSALADSRGRIWFGHERGFSRFDPKNGTVKVFKTEFAKGGDCNPNSLYETEGGKIVIGTTEGLIVYDFSKDREKVMAPINNILSVTISSAGKSVKYAPRELFSLPYDKYTVRIDFVGVNLSDPGKVYYSTKLENFDDAWSELSLSRYATYPLRDGRYRFNLISVNEDGLSEDQPVYFDIFIKKPFWRTFWFISLVVAIIAGIIIIIIREREKAQRKIKEYLESELAERTRLVMKQKDEIELQNIEITDSINYAKRIQSSILPDINKLKDTFSDAFIIFHPRDIVSGDFYWFDKIDKDRFIVVCADSTGHGVPGAFMSMIGSTLLQDIISRKGITRPSQVLGLLDKQIFSTLNQNIDVGVSNDGMDMIVCEINTRTRLVRFASAMRPVIIVMGGESYYIKGNRCSVGGESVIEKYFDDQEYYLSEGDTLYMFSDGLPDQFGGADGKKMKIARMKKLIEDVSKQPMSQQKQIISDFFFEWKGDYEQVDDILLMGIRV